MADREVEEGIVWAIIGYIGILFLVPLLAKKDNKFALYHAKQGLVLFIADIIVWVVAFILMFIPFIGWLIGAILWILLLVLFIIGIVNAATGKYKALPIIGGIAEKWKI
jgi:uncharacterized membrane protein